MRGSNGYRVALACVVIVVAATVLPALFGRGPQPDIGDLGDPWRNFVFNYQTLITGIAAVVAAFFTIRQISETDSRQERRHNELVKLQMRPDRLCMERAINPQLEHIRYINTKLRAYDFGLESFAEMKGAPEWHWLTKVSQDWIEDLTGLQEIIKRPQFRDALYLFDGRTTHAIYDLEAFLPSALEALQKHRRFESDFDPNISEHEEYDQNFTSIFEKLSVGFVFITLGAVTLADLMRLAAAEYDIEIR
ncbi:DUF1109 domain-containing protein [Rhizobium azibense]|uniref:Uncharacterized protein n=1 Tax=Rhizobium azibense TaxID=1136135 RepID=A0A4R3RUM1_9HYPH|nr:DUF1109 domain-containing protein [Rhizobium azibense]TCU35426.1 hypothetical protein EV129_10916 [Rhizobium azibense]